MYVTAPKDGETVLIARNDPKTHAIVYWGNFGWTEYRSQARYFIKGQHEHALTDIRNQVRDPNSVHFVY